MIKLIFETWDIPMLNMQLISAIWLVFQHSRTKRHPAPKYCLLLLDALLSLEVGVAMDEILIHCSLSKEKEGVVVSLTTKRKPVLSLHSAWNNFWKCPTQHLDKTIFQKQAVNFLQKKSLTIQWLMRYRSDPLGYDCSIINLTVRLLYLHLLYSYN